MDTTAAAELGMGEPVVGMDGAGFWDAGAPGLDQWGDNEDDESVENDLSWDRAGPHGSAAVAQEYQQASHSGFGRGRAISGAEPTQKVLRTMPDGNRGPNHHNHSGNHQGFGGHGGGIQSGRGGSAAGGAGLADFGAVGSSSAGAGAVGRGRGMGSIFYKTKLCSRFRSGNCPYSTNCNFAHGMEELRKPPPGWEEFVASQEFPPPPPSQPGGQGGSGSAAGSTDSQVRFHKTRPCKKYFGEGNCPYGEKCNFLHDEHSVPRAVREARDAAVAAASGAVVAASPKVEMQLAPTTNGNTKEGEGGSSTPAGSATPNARPSNWKTRLCNKWETTGHCPFEDKCHFAHGSDELQRYGGGLPDSSAPALSDSKSGGTPSQDTVAVSSYQRHQGGASSARSGSKGKSNWRGPNEISTIYGDWWIEDDDWQRGATTTIHEAAEPESDVRGEVQRRTTFSVPSASTPKTVPFFRRSTGLEPSRQQNFTPINRCAIVAQMDGEVNQQSFQYEGVKEDVYGSVLQPEQGWRR
ncbi:zinc finger CCCH domain-containing protein 12 isoform X1 [Physcomitrium patens]|uniref:C3H1-type domain-containing protein n=1 Tax=Physcomitrium patens TaxID=3218 RepID=A0A2K1L8W4_PHYPA|nr:zinc finger CCCH domain-containing protein 56-like isoform X1 [Physcomitrium patens]PNR62457.1 hypothetical protein PHYPA_000881 [Physcomitrium patens]|eukprot:XP_024375302.1 zinc finger CCCH domain-containing protein 56-like isoform X1 [Physcomitrella patens]